MSADAVTDGGHCNSCDFETNWRVAAGSLKRTVVFESSSEDYPLADSSPDSVYDAFTPLVLKPEVVADSGPCEIKLCFMQKHEIRQIYVRSTARVYEVYYTKSLQSDNEYLCTVRCSIAERDDQVLQAQDSSENTENSSAELKEETLASEGNGGTTEDDWVEVKVLDSSLENKMNSLSCRKNANAGSHIQDFYEATAEISDLDPCSSITIRFLSLQNRSCLCVDEVYVFSDPVSEIDSDYPVQDVKGSVGSSIMSLLAPTLLQFSKSGMSQIRHQASSDLEKCNKIETQSKPTDPTDLTSHLNEKGSNDQQSVNVQRVDKSTTEPAETHLFTKSLDTNKSDNLGVKDDSAYGHIEKVLEQLMCRVGRIEEVCLRFEENMLKPLRSMETRIQHVEQKLEELVNNSQHSEFPPCLKISAPSFSWNSNSSSFHNDVRDCQSCRAPESEKEEMTSGVLSNATGGITSSVNFPHLLPSLVVTAPDFSCEDDIDVDGTKSPKISPRESKKKRSIDDVFAESLSRFLSASTGALSEHERFPLYSAGTSEITSGRMPVESVQVTDGVDIISDVNAEEEPSRYTQVLTVMAPEFSYEENANAELLNYAESFSVASLKFANEIGERCKDVNPEGNEDVCAKVNSDFSDTSRDSLVSDQSSICGMETYGKMPDGISSGVADADNQVSESSGTRNFIARSIDDKGQNGSNQLEPVNSMGFGKDRDFEPVSGPKIDDNHITVAAGSVTKYVADGPDGEILQNLLEMSNASLVDFGIPILDVKFTPDEDSKSQLPLETLLDDAINKNVEADISQRIQDVYPQETNFIDINEGGETGDSLAGKYLVMDGGICGSTEESIVRDSCSTGKQETVESLI